LGGTSASFSSSVSSLESIYPTNKTSGFSPFSIFQNGNKLTLAGGTSGIQFNDNANSTPLVSILNSGNVGINATTGFNQISGTETTLKIANSNVASLYLEVTGVRGYANFVSPAGNLVWYDYTAASNRMFLFSDGNLLLTNGAASNAGFKLDVNGTGRFNVSQVISNDGTYGSTYKMYSFTGQTDGFHRIFAGTADDMYFAAATARGFQFRPNGSTNTTLSIASTGAATFSSSLTAATDVTLNNGTLFVSAGSGTSYAGRLSTAYIFPYITTYLDSFAGAGWEGRLVFRTNSAGGAMNTALTILNSGAVTISGLAGSGNRIVVANSGGTLISAVIGSGLAFDGTTLTATGGGSGSISGSGTSGTVALFTGATSIGNSVITQSSGNVLIGTGTPAARLTVVGATTLIGQTNVSARFSDDNNSTLLISHPAGTSNTATITGNINLGFATGSSGSITEKVRILSNGRVLIGTQTDNGSLFRIFGPNGLGTFFHAQNDGATGAIFERIGNTFPFNQYTFANGNVLVGGSVTATSFFESSDATLKTLVEDDYQAKGIDSVVAKLYIKNGKQELGYFAQDLEGILPSAVSKGSDGLLNLSYREVHTAKIAYLEEEIRQIKKRYEIN
jgi:hypothetical protein